MSPKRYFFHERSYVAIVSSTRSSLLSRRERSSSSPSPRMSFVSRRLFRLSCMKQMHGHPGRSRRAHLPADWSPMCFHMDVFTMEHRICGDAGYRKLVRVNVKFFATLREAAGIASISLNVDDLGSLISHLSMNYGLTTVTAGNDLDAISDSLVILVNGQNIRQLKGMDTPLTDDDEVSLFPPISGG